MKRNKTMLIVPLAMVLLAGCSERRYLLADKGQEKRFLIETIHEAAEKGEISRKPLILVDEIPYRYGNELKKRRLHIKKEDIQRLVQLPAGKAMPLFGADASGGVILITSKAYDKERHDGHVLIFRDGVEISKADMEKLDPNDIESIDVIKDKEKIKQYTSKDFDGVIEIHLKKR